MSLMSDDDFIPLNNIASPALTGSFTMATTAPTRTEKTSPDGYRLAKKPDGTLVLQGAYFWQEGWNTYGHEWRDIPTVDLETHNVEGNSP